MTFDPDAYLAQPRDFDPDEYLRQQPAAAQARPQSWADVPGMALSNIPSSAASFAGNLYEAVTSPIETIKGLGDIGAGALQAITPRPIADFINKFEFDPAARQRAIDTAAAAGGAIRARYGSEEGLKTTLATDPVGAVGDLALLLSGGGGLAAKVPGLARAGAATSAAGAAIDPLVLALRGAGKVGQGAAAAVKQGVGLSSGVGAAPLTEATRAGRAGGADAEMFRQNIRGQATMTDVLADAKANLQNIQQARGEQYRANKAAYADDADVLDFADIDAALGKSIESVTVTGAEGTRLPKIGRDEMAKIQEVEAVIGDWRKSPDLHTVEGLDALKQRIGAIYPDSPKQTQAQRVITETYNAVKSTIEQQAPGYAKTMKDYSAATDLIREIERALSLGQKASADTAMRKLQSLMRNNVNTSYGYRTDLARALEDAGGRKIMPALAGQTLSEWMPRGIQRATTLPSGGLAYMLGGPLAAGVSLAASSPRLMGESAFKIGQAQRMADQLRRLSPSMPISARDAARIGQQIERLKQEGVEP